jgi:hypothetical protein
MNGWLPQARRIQFLEPTWKFPLGNLYTPFRISFLPPWISLKHLIGKFGKLVNFLSCPLGKFKITPPPPPPPPHRISRPLNRGCVPILNGMAEFILNWQSCFSPFYLRYRKPVTISPGLIFFRKRFLMGLYKGGGGAYIRGGLIHGRSFVLV